MIQNYMREAIDTFLADYASMREDIERLTKRYRLEDFVFVTENCQNALNGVNDSAGFLSGCLDDRKSGMDIWYDTSYMTRLTNEYLQFVYELLESHTVNNKLYYIVAYHYLLFCKHMWFQLAEGPQRLFSFDSAGNLSPRAKSEMESLEDLYNGSFSLFIPFFTEKDLKFYWKVYKDFGWHYHSTKHFSLLAEVIECAPIISRYDLVRMFGGYLDAFCFRYVLKLGTVRNRIIGELL